jgi:hypothetical protein
VLLGVGLTLQLALQITREELVQQLRNQGKGGQTKTSRFRGVMKHAKGKWEARLGQVCGSKYQYLGLFSTEIDAAVAYDRALIAQHGLDCATNSALDNYDDMLGALQLQMFNCLQPVVASPDPAKVHKVHEQPCFDDAFVASCCERCALTAQNAF